MRYLFLNSKKFFLSLFLFLFLVVLTGWFLFSEKSESEIKKLDVYLKIAKEIDTVDNIEDKKDFVIALLGKLDREFNLSKDERNYVALLRSSFQKGDFREASSLFLSSKDIKVGIIIAQNKKFIVLKKDPDINEKIVKAESIFYDFLKNESFEGLQGESYFFPTVLVSKVFNEKFSFIFLKNKDNWKKFSVIVNSDKFSPDSMRLFYLIGKILSSGVGPFFVKNNYFVITVRDRFKEDFLVLEEIKVKIMSLLFLRILKEKKLLETSEKAILELFFNDFPEESLSKKVIMNTFEENKYLVQKKDFKGVFIKLKKLLRKIIQIERKGDLKAFKSLKGYRLND